MATTRSAHFTANAAFDSTGLGTQGSAIGWLSNKQTLVSGSPGTADDKVLIHYTITCGTVTVGNDYEFYLVRADPAGGHVDAGFTLSGTTSGVTPTYPTNLTASTVRDLLQALYSQPMSITTSGSVYTGSFIIYDPGPVFALYTYNNTGAALTAAGITYESIDDSYA